jgi:tetratricopeptide (TPR) repeat protein
MICGSDRWVNVDKYRAIKKDMHMCQDCGFVSYPERYKKQDEMKEYYKNSYRNPPNINNLFTGTRKLHYHAKFLGPTVIKKWTEEKKTDPVICDIGAAYGLFLNWWSTLNNANGPLFPDVKLYGTELTKSYKLNAYHEFGLNLSDEFDTSIDYDLITSYKSAEHIFDFDKHLLQYREALKAKNGLLYISVPTWFRIMHNFGVGNNFDIEYYYHPDHVNVWTEAQFRYLLGKCGFKVIQEDHIIYDSTYLCELCEPFEDESLIFSSIDYARQSLESIKKADQLFANGDFKGAIDTYPNFPGGWKSYYEKNRALFDKKGFESIEKEIIEKLPKIDEYNIEFKYFSADLYMRYQKWEKALEVLQSAAASKPGCPNLLMNIAHCYRALSKEHAIAGNQEKSWQFLADARKITRHLKDVDPSAFAEAVNWIYNDNSKLPAPYKG